jgi:hypothetical protein
VPECLLCTTTILDHRDITWNKPLSSESFHSRGKDGKTLKEVHITMSVLINVKKNIKATEDDGDSRILEWVTREGLSEEVTLSSSLKTGHSHES